MWAIIRVVVFEWILARIGLRWLFSLAAIGGLAVLLLVGLPTLIILVVIGLFVWRALRKPEPAPPA